METQLNFQGGFAFLKKILFILKNVKQPQNKENI